MPKPAKSTSTARPRSSLLGASQTNAIVARDLLAAVGEVMLRWGYLESAMLKAVGGSSRTPIVQRWLTTVEPGAEIADEIKDAAAVRHLLAHGLCEIQARPQNGGEAEVPCCRVGVLGWEDVDERQFQSDTHRGFAPGWSAQHRGAPFR